MSTTQTHEITLICNFHIAWFCVISSIVYFLKYYTSQLNQDLFRFNPCFRIIMKYHVGRATKTLLYACRDEWTWSMFWGEIRRKILKFPKISRCLGIHTEKELASSASASHFQEKYFHVLILYKVCRRAKRNKRSRWIIFKATPRYLSSYTCRISHE